MAQRIVRTHQSRVTKARAVRDSLDSGGPALAGYPSAQHRSSGQLVHVHGLACFSVLNRSL